MKLLMTIAMFIGVSAFAGEDKVELCKSVSQVTDFYACDVGAGIFFISKYNQAYLPKPPAPPAQAAEAPKAKKK